MNNQDFLYLISVKEIKRQKPLNLTEREKIIVEGLFNNQTHKEIAYNLSCSRQNIEQSIKTACEKNQVADEKQLLIKYGIANAIQIGNFAI